MTERRIIGYHALVVVREDDDNYYCCAWGTGVIALHKRMVLTLLTMIYFPMKEPEKYLVLLSRFIPIIRGQEH